MVQLPALNTPQFEWSRSRLPRHPQPMPPIYQPAVAAAAILWAVQAKKREVSVGASTVATILANKLAPGAVDRYLAAVGYDAQQTDAPVDPERPDNLFEPVPGEHGTHGVFDSQARQRSFQLWATTHHLGSVGNVLAAFAGTINALRGLFR